MFLQLCELFTTLPHTIKLKPAGFFTTLLKSLTMTYLLYMLCLLKKKKKYVPKMKTRARTHRETGGCQKRMFFFFLLSVVFSGILFFCQRCELIHFVICVFLHVVDILIEQEPRTFHSIIWLHFLFYLFLFLVDGHLTFHDHFTSSRPPSRFITHSPSPHLSYSCFFFFACISKF